MPLRQIRTALDVTGLAIPALIVATLAVLALALLLISQASLAHTIEARTAAAASEARSLGRAAMDLRQALSDAETNQRAYVLTGARRFLSDYKAARGSVRRNLQALGAQAGGAAPGASEPRKLEALVGREMASLDQGIRLARSGRLDAATKRAADDGRDMAELRAALDRLAAREAEQETAARAEYRRFSADAQRRQTVLAAATLIALLLATAALVLEQLGARRAARVQAQLTRELGDARRSAEQANTAKSRFLATASHDMRQPLHALTLYIASLQRRVDTSDARDILGKMNVAVRSMTRLFNALLDMARLEAGVLKPDVGEFALDDLLEEVAAQALESRQISTARLRIVRTRLRVRSDPDLLVIVLRNLANNALKHSGGARVLLGCRRSGSAVSIEVHDDGQGIPADQLQALFGEFVRGERAASKEGVGLGLAIVERVSELLDHPLEVRSEVGRGSVFSIRVPRALARPEAARPLPARIGLDGARILLADDDPLVLDAMRRALEDAGAGVTAAATSEEARRKAQAGAYDLLILDLNLGRDNGLRILEELEASGLDAPGLIVTGATTPELLQQLRRAGRRWLTKPLTADEVAAAAGDLLRTPSARRPSSSRSPPPASGRREPDRSPPGGF